MRFVLIDELLALEPGRSARARTTFRGDSEIFADHFPGFPIVPGVLVTEAMAQTGGWLLAATARFERWPILVMIRHAKFRRLVLPDQELQLTATVQSGGSSLLTRAASEVGVHADVNGVRVATAVLTFYFRDEVAAGQDASRFAQWTRETFERLRGPAALERRSPDAK